MFPSIVFIFSDQHRHDCAGYAGHPVVRTPNLDRLAAEGMAFTHAGCAAPVCSPSRQSLLTGQWPVTHGGLCNYNLSECRSTPPVSTDFFTRHLKVAGYWLGLTGSWHVSGDYGPRDAGYDEELDAQAFRRPGASTSAPSPGLSMPPAPPRVTGEDVEDCPSALRTRAAIDFIRRHSRDPQPFFVSLHLAEPHPPYDLPEEYARMYDPARIPPWWNWQDDLAGKPRQQRQMRRVWDLEGLGWGYWAKQVAGYFGSISLVDRHVGQVLGVLDELGLSERTMVVYTTDHGDLTGAHGLFDKHCCMYDELVRVPLLVRWPGVVAPGSRYGRFASNSLDLAATFVELVEGKAPVSYQGLSLLAVLRGQDDGSPYRDQLLCAYHGGQFGLYSQRMLRDQRWKYVWNVTDQDELYDLQADPGELVNLADDPAHGEHLAQMRRRLYGSFAALGDPLLGTRWVKHMLLDGAIL